MLTAKLKNGRTIAYETYNRERRAYDQYVYFFHIDESKLVAVHREAEILLLDLADANSTP